MHYYNNINTSIDNYVNTFFRHHALIQDDIHYVQYIFQKAIFIEVISYLFLTILNVNVSSNFDIAFVELIFQPIFSVLLRICGFSFRKQKRCKKRVLLRKKRKLQKKKTTFFLFNRNVTIL